MKKFSFAAILLMVAAIASCSKDGIQEDTNHLSLGPNLSSGIDPDVTDISENDAIKVALMSQHQSKTKSEIQKEVQNIIPCFGKDGKEVFYAINYTNGCGYTLVSASKNYYPILAEVEKGSFEENVYQTGVSILLDEYKYAIDNNRSLPYDSVKLYRSFWRDFETKNVLTINTKSEGDEFPEFIASSIEQWQSEGYEIYELGYSAPEGLPQDIYQNWCSIAETIANDNPSEFAAFILYKKERTSTERGPLLTTKWDQEPPYNLSVPQGIDVGCVAVAVGQIMRFHRWPQRFDWSNMPDTLSSTETRPTTVSDFLYDVGLKCGIQYWLKLTGSDSFLASHALKFYYDYSCDRISHSHSKVYSEIMSGNPVYMEGYRSSFKGHAWVCDGVRHSEVNEKYEFRTISNLGGYPLHFESPSEPYKTSSDGFTHFYMNWGWGGDYNGWYLDDLRHYDQNYSIKRKDIIKIRPKK